MSRLHLVQIWDIAAVLLLLPVLALIGSGLPGDWQVHGGSALTGTATVVAVEPVRTGKHILVDVSNDAGRAVATRQEGQWRTTSGTGCDVRCHLPATR